MVRGVFRYRLTDGKLLAKYPVPPEGADLVNDLVVAPDGSVYATASNSGSLLRIPPDGAAIEVFLRPHSLPDPNGITVSPDSPFLFIAGWYGITRVDLKSKTTMLLTCSPEIPAGCIDGLYEYHGDLVGIQNRVHETGRVLRLHLNARRDTILSSEVLESYNPLFEGITTGAIAGRDLCFVANTQFRKTGPDGSIPAGVGFNPLPILRLRLRTTSLSSNPRAPRRFGSRCTNPLQVFRGSSFSEAGRSPMSARAASWKSGNRSWMPIVVLSGVVFVAALIVMLERNASVPAAPARREDTLAAVAPNDPQQATDDLGLVAGSAALPERASMQAELKSAPAGSLPKSSASADRKIVRTGSLELIVTGPAEAAEQIRSMAESMGGYLEAAQIGGTKEAPVASITIRVPAVHFEDAKAGIRKLAARVESEKSDAQEVTRQYVDVEARLRNLRAEEAQYLTIMKSAYKVDDLLSVSQKLSEVRGEIEQQQAEFQTLSKQVETVAITVSLRAQADAQVFGLNWRPLYQLKIAARAGLEAMADYTSAMAAILFYVPVVLAWSLTILFTGVIGWRLARWAGRRFFAWPSTPGLTEKASGSI